MRVKKMASLLMVLILLVVMAPPGTIAAENQDRLSDTEPNNLYLIGTKSSDMIAGGGRAATYSGNMVFLSEDGGLYHEDRLLATGNLSCLNLIDDTVFFVSSHDERSEIQKASISSGQTETVLDLEDATIRELYVVAAEDFFYLTDEGVYVYHGNSCREESLIQSSDCCSFAPTPYGIVYATGSLFHYDLFADGKLIASDVDGYYTDFNLNGGSLVFTKHGETFQVTLQSAFVGDCVISDFLGYETVEAQCLFANLNNPDKSFERDSVPGKRSRQVNKTANRKTLSTGVQNIVKRAYQMTNIQWTPLANITGWNGEMTYQAGRTYTGLPYGQPVYASYVPWSTSLTDFIAAVNNPNSKMYTSQSTYDSVAPYYSCDCSAFVSWAWNLASRQTTTYIPSYATLVSNSTYTGLQVGDCFCKKQSHVVLVTDITYDDNGVINGVEISESTVNLATNYCCQKTWYGPGYSYPLSMLQTKYIESGYGLYRSLTRDNASYTHYCVVPLEGDVCELCGLNSYTSYQTYATVRFLTDTPIFGSPDGGAEQSGTAYAERELNITAYTTIDGVVWYHLETSGWVKANQTLFLGYVKSVSLTDDYLPCGRLVQGHVFPIEGIITSTNPITEITATISTIGGVQEQAKTVSFDGITSYSLRSSPIDNAMVFNQVPIGEHVMVLRITETAACAGQSSEQLITEIECPFTIYSVTGERTVSAQGIDVSRYQGDIDWNTVAQSIDFAIIRCGWGDDETNQDDDKWLRNVNACTQLGIPFGVYIYSYALTDEQALSEALHAIRLLDGFSPSLPVYLDLEDENTIGKLSCSEILKHTKIFCDAIEAAGYVPGVYATTSWWSGKLASGEYNRWSRWVARFSDNLNYNGELSAWQYSDTGAVSGISGNVDLDYWYGDFPGLQSGHEHSYTNTVTIEPTCINQGVRTYTCSVCGHQYEEAIPALDHLFGDWTAVLEPTCTTDGRMSRYCDRCGEVQEQAIPATGHEFQNGVCIYCGTIDPGIQKGDINGDGAITSSDAVLMARFLVNLIEFSERQIYAADFNGDGAITSADAVMISKVLIN